MFFVAPLLLIGAWRMRTRIPFGFAQSAFTVLVTLTAFTTTQVSVERRFLSYLLAPCRRRLNTGPPAPVEIWTTRC